MSSDNPQRSVLLIGKSQLVLEDTVARARRPPIAGIASVCPWVSQRMTSAGSAAQVRPRPSQQPKQLGIGPQQREPERPTPGSHAEPRCRWREALTRLAHRREQ
jgi:hypothetical protein